MSSPTFRYAIDPRTDIVVVFEGTTPDLNCRFQRFIANGETIVVTTPQGEDNPDLQTIHYIEDFQYLYEGTFVNQVDVANIIGETVEVRFTFSPGAGETLTGVLEAMTPEGILRVNVGGDTHIIKDYHYFEIQ